MPDRQKSTAPPEPLDAYDAVLRRAWATRFDNPVVPEALEQVGRLLTDSCQEGHLWGTTHDLGVVRCGLAAVAEDLESLAHFLGTEVADGPTTYSVP